MLLSRNLSKTIGVTKFVLTIEVLTEKIEYFPHISKCKINSSVFEVSMKYLGKRKIQRLARSYLTENYILRWL